MKRLLTEFAVNLDNPSAVEGSGKLPRIVDGFISVRGAGTGLFLIRRDALERIIRPSPELNYKPEGGYDWPNIIRNWYGFFDLLIEGSRRFVARDWHSVTGGERDADGRSGVISSQRLRIMALRSIVSMLDTLTSRRNPGQPAISHGRETASGAA